MGAFDRVNGKEFQVQLITENISHYSLDKRVAWGLHITFNKCYI